MTWKNTLTAFAILITTGIIHAQSAVLTAGGEADGSGGSFSYSVGQVAYTHFGGEDGSISLGVQQPYVTIIIGTDNPGSEITANVFPNPANATIHLEMGQYDESFSSGKLFFELFDTEGKLLSSDEITSNITNVPVQHLSNGLYLLRVRQEGQEIKTFKIFKTN